MSAQTARLTKVADAKTPQRRRSVRWLGALAASGIGAYLWWPLPSASGGQPPTQAAVLAPAVPTASPATPPPAAAAPASAARRVAATTAQAESRGRPARPSPAASQSASPLRLSKSTARPTLDRAYAGLQAGRLDAALRDYAEVLRSDTKNTDALLGLATIAARRGQGELAQHYYLRALESDPNDATALAGLINTRGQAAPGLAESHLKSALAGQPESPALHFALGNVYSRQSRWSEAQQAYFRAYSGEPDNADIIFNLAVSLDHLHQDKLAAQYYRMALDDNRAQRRSFDPNQVRQRIAELQP